MSGAVNRREPFAPSDITVPSRLRPNLNEDTVARLMQSIGAIGLQTPPTVRWMKDAQGEDDVVLVAGMHRIEACKRLGMTMVDCIVQNWTDDQARMWEIAENLHRADLTALERSEHVSEWIRLSDAAQPVPHERKAGQQPGGVKAAARDLGINRMDAHRAVKVDSLTPEAKQAARDTGLADNRTALLKAAQQPPERQEATMRSYEPTRSKPAPAIKHAYESEEDWRRALFTVWNRGAQDWRDRAMETLDGPVFDRTQAA